MGKDFYEGQINQLNSNEAIREINGFVKDYLNAGTIEEANNIKDLIIQKAIQELSPNEIIAVRDSISERAKTESGKTKAKLYELAAGLYNATDPRNAPQQVPIQPYPYNQQQIPFQGNGFESMNDYPPFEVVGGTVTKKVINLLKGIKPREQTYVIRGGDVEPIGNGLYRIYLDTGRTRQESITIGYRGGNVIQVLDNYGNILGSVRFRNSRTEYMDFQLKQDGTKIRLQLSFPDRNNRPYNYRDPRYNR